MALLACCECAKEISSDADACPQCGARQKTAGVRWWLVIPILSIVAILLISAASQPAPVTEKSRDQAAIKICWQEHDRKSLTPVEKRFIAGACEKMEQDFVAQHGGKP